MFVKDIFVLKKALYKIFKIQTESETKDQKKFIKNHCHYDKNIKKLVMKFQKKKHMEESGVVDKEVWTKIMEAACKVCDKDSPQGSKKQKVKSQI